MDQLRQPLTYCPSRLLHCWTMQQICPPLLMRREKESGGGRERGFGVGMEVRRLLLQWEGEDDR